MVVEVAGAPDADVLGSGVRAVRDITRADTRAGGGCQRDPAEDGLGCGLALITSDIPIVGFADRLKNSVVAV